MVDWRPTAATCGQPLFPFSNPSGGPELHCYHTASQEGCELCVWLHTVCFQPHTHPHNRGTVSRRRGRKRQEGLAPTLRWVIGSAKMDSYSARFGGIRRLVSADGLERLRSSHVCVVGLGGVGSWAVEALTRSGIGTLTLVDMDDVCITNVSRQIQALGGEFGKPKVEVMERRVKAINPDCIVHPLQSFFLKSTAEEILQQRFDFVLDAIDDSDMKCLLISKCRERGIRVIASGASAGRRDPTAIEVTDLAFCSHDRLLQGVRKKLRRHYGFPAADQLLGVECVLSREQMVYARDDGTLCNTKEEGIDLRQDCHTGYGSASFVTGAFGLVAASRVVTHLAGLSQEPIASPPKRKSQRPTWTPTGAGL